MLCSCGHHPSKHNPSCRVCINCGGMTSPSGCCRDEQPCSCATLDVPVVERWAHPRDAAAEAVLWSLIASVAEENKKTVRDYLVDILTAEDSRGVDAVVNGQIIGSVTRSKPAEKLDVTDPDEFLRYVIHHRPDLLTVDYKARDAILRTLTEVDGHWIDPAGVVVDGVGTRMTTGAVRINPDPKARDVVRELLADGLERGYGIKQIEDR